MKTSLVVTVLNEEKSISSFLWSVFKQTKKPDEIIIVDAGSTDATASVISNFIPIQSGQISNKQKIKLFIKKGNRSIGRNEAVKHTTGDIIVCTDAGNILDKDWVSNITGPFKNHNVDVVAGHYRGLAKTTFQKCLVPYVLVMPDKVDPSNFLPATRSLAFKKSVWKKVGGFPKEYSHNEDYVFAKRLEKIGATIVFAKDAIAYWIPRKDLAQVFVMFFRFALGDAQANIYRPKVIFIFIRYFLGVVILCLLLLYRSSFLLITFGGLLFLYVLWSIKKNYKYVKKMEAFYLLPLIQLTSDTAVLFGTTAGLIKRV